MRRALAVTRLIAVCLVPIAMALVPLGMLDHARPICIYTLVTGSHCWGCGMTRALCAGVRGDFITAFHYNPRVVVVLPVLFAVWLRMVRREIDAAGEKTGEAPFAGASR